MKASVESGRSKACSREWRPVTRWAASLVIVLHLLAVFVPPFTFQTSPIRGLGSPLAETLLDLMRPYIDAAYLNHGYAFFAPDPGPSHLLQVHLEFDDGRPPKELTIPHRSAHWPRLLYHRHFMLSEHLYGAFVPLEPPSEIRGNAAELQNYRYARELYERRRTAIQQYLLRRYGAAGAKVVRVEHELVSPYEVISLRRELDDPETFLELSEEEGGPLDR